MSDPIPGEEMSGFSQGDRSSALFAQMVLQQSNMAMMLLGKVPHPETGQPIRDFEAARLFIDQLEMLEEKTKGNLNKAEQGLLKQSLMSLHMAFVEAVESPAPSKAPETDAAEKPGESQNASPTAGTATTAEDESRKKFSKKY